MKFSENNWRTCFLINVDLEDHAYASHRQRDRSRCGYQLSLTSLNNSAFQYSNFTRHFNTSISHTHRAGKSSVDKFSSGPCLGHLEAPWPCLDRRRFGLVRLDVLHGPKRDLVQTGSAELGFVLIQSRRQPAREMNPGHST